MCLTYDDWKLSTPPENEEWIDRRHWCDCGRKIQLLSEEELMCDDCLFEIEGE